MKKSSKYKVQSSKYFVSLQPFMKKTLLFFLLLGAVVALQAQDDSLRQESVADGFAVSPRPAFVADGFAVSFTDDASVVEAYGHPITLVDGNRENIKITTPYDLKIAGALVCGQL